MSVSTNVTAEQLEKDHPPFRCELIRGEIIEMSPAGRPHGRIAMQIGRLIANHVFEHDLGEAYAAETGFILERNPDTVRAPDASFVTHERLQKAKARGFVDVAPNLVVEVISPDDSQRYVAEKVEQWLSSGAEVVWTIDPEKETALTHVLREEQVIDEQVTELVAEHLLPGFVVQVENLF